MANPGVTITIGQARRAPRPPGNTVIGVVGDAPQAHADFPARTNSVPGIYLVTNPPAVLADPSNNFGTIGSIPEALAGIDANTTTSVVVVRVIDRTANFSAPSTADLQAGIKALESAASIVGTEPHLILCPDFTWNRGVGPGYEPLDTASEVMTQLQATATVLDAIAVVAAPPTSVALAKTWAGMNEKDRAYAVFPHIVNAAGETVDPSGYVAGALANGNVWDNPMFKDVLGITRTSIPLSFHPRNQSDDAASLQEDNITALVSREGYHLWGATLLVDSSSTDPARFINVLREVDDLDLQLDAVSEAALQRNLVAGFADYVISHLQQYIDGRIAQGALATGTVTLDTEANTQSELSSGNVHFRIDITPAFPAQRLTYVRTLTTAGITV